MPGDVNAELMAAKRVAAAVGLGEVRPEVLKLAHHTTVRLAPTAIVARIKRSDASDDSDAKLKRELAVARYLASQGAPSVRPAATGAGPYSESGHAITLWEFAAGRAPETDEDALIAARALKEVHRALQGIAIPLPSFAVAFESCERILLSKTEAPKLIPADRAFLQKLYAKLQDELGGYQLPSRPLHGDAHLGNVLISDNRAIWMDLDDLCTGPLEWDVASLPEETWPEFEEVDRDLVRLLANLRSLCVAAWCWADFDRTADAREAALDHLQELKARFAPL